MGCILNLKPKYNIKVCDNIEIYTIEENNGKMGDHYLENSYILIKTSMCFVICDYKLHLQLDEMNGLPFLKLFQF